MGTPATLNALRERHTILQRAGVAAIEERRQAEEREAVAASLSVRRERINSARKSHERIRQALAALPQPFTFAQLCVAVWQLDWLRWGLTGDPSHPCSRRIASEMYMRPYGWIARGWLESVGKGKYRLKNG